VLAYASTKDTEARFGAVSLSVDPAVSTGAGFSKPTRIYPARLVLAAPGDFLRMTGRLVRELPRLYALLRVALGIGTGTGRLAPSNQLSWRGRVVRLGSRLRSEVGFTFAVVLTEHRYSANRRYQIVVPLESPGILDPVDTDLVVIGRNWLRVLDMEATGAILAVAEVQSVFHRDDIEGWTGALIDSVTLDALEKALQDLFGM
jgi:hypothetical protein